MRRVERERRRREANVNPIDMDNQGNTMAEFEMDL